MVAQSQSVTESELGYNVPLTPSPYWGTAAREIAGSCMVEIDVYYFYWLSQLTAPLANLSAGVPLIGNVEALAYARMALNRFNEDAALARAFPRTADKAKSLIAGINALIPEVGQEIQGLQTKRLSPGEVDRIKAFHSAITPVLRDESMHNYVVCLVNQRALSVYALVEKIEECFAAKCWDRMHPKAKREFEESGKCLAFERYTGTGFHALRGVEVVIRQWIEEVSGSLPTKRDWGAYIETMKRNGADPGLTAVLDNIRSLERNPLMHPEDWLDLDEGIAIFNLSQTAVSRIMADLEIKKPSPK